MSIYIYRVYQPTPGGLWRRIHWNTDTHQAFDNYVSGATNVLYPDNTIIDVYQKTPTQVAIVIFNSSYNGGNGLAYPRLFINETIVVGSGGDTNNVLLFKKCNTTESPQTFEFGIYSLTDKVVTVYSYPISFAPFCSAFALDETTIIQQYCMGTTLRRVYYDGDEGVNLVDTVNSVLCGYVAPVPDVTVTEEITIKADHGCYDNPVYLVWKNSLGGWSQWLFGKTQTEGLSTENIGSFSQNITDLADEDTTSDTLGKNVGDTLLLGASNLTTNQKDAIKEILFSPKVYKMDEDGNKQTVEVKPGTWAFETKDNRHTVEFEIILPQRFTIKN